MQITTLHQHLNSFIYTGGKPIFEQCAFVFFNFFRKTGDHGLVLLKFWGAQALKLGNPCLIRLGACAGWMH